MYATKALEYLLLNPSERINYRAERGISIKQWYESFKPQPLQGRFTSFQEAREILGLKEGSFTKLNKQGFFGETKRKGHKTGYMKSSELNRIIEKESMLVPIQEFYTLIEKERWYTRNENFDKTFKKYYKKVHYNSKKRYVTISNAAKIIYELKKRKEIIEDWPTLRDLNIESGINLSKRQMHIHYSRMIKRGELAAIRIGSYDIRGDRIAAASHYKIPPGEYQRILTNERNNIKSLRLGMTSSEIARMTGLLRRTVTNKIYLAKRLNLLHPIELTYHPRNIKYVLTPQEASLLINRKLVIPSCETLKRKQQREMILSGDLNNPQLSIRNVSRSIEWELWQKIREGDNNAFNILLKLYEPLLNEVASNYVIPWTSQEERRNLLISALFEIVQEYSIRRTKRGDVINLATKKIKERWRKEEAPSWASLDAKLGPDGEDTFLNLLDNQHQLWLKTNSKARHSE